ncbi:MAG TPA: pyridoxamine 5'-phosphate oxidase family protein [Acidimicrobiales bacterium]|nr:pyridoxamine 5'-phosphate oxidase family protein [Acidimicrobiales bacterium]
MDHQPRAGRVTLGRAECVDRLRSADLARVVVSVRCLPAALPVRIEVPDPARLVLTTTEEAVAAAARRGDVLSVQIDGLEPGGATWSVMASGIARLAGPDAPSSQRLRDAVARGATVAEIPLSVVVGERVA